MVKRSLAGLYPRLYDVPVMLATSIIALVSGLFLPTLTLRELIFHKQTFSILTGIENLYKERYIALALIVFVFSVVFPILKLIALGVLWFVRLAEESRSRIVSMLGILGKWSMLDVFVVAVTIVITKLSGLIEADAHIGIYVFTVSVFLSMVTAMRIESLVRKI